MAKKAAKKKEGKESGSMGTLISVVKEGMKSIFSVHEMVHNVKQHFQEVVERSIKQLMASLLILAGSLFLIIAVLYFMIDQLGLSKSTTFLIGGVVLLFFAFIMKYQLMKQEAH